MICTVLYILVSFLLTGTVHYTRLNVGAPVSLAIRETGVRWGSYVVNAGALAGLSTVMLVMLLGQSRVFYSMSRDGLLWKWAGEIHPKFRTPWKSSIVVGIFVACFAAVVPIGVLGELVSIGTLLAFVIVCAGIWILRVRRPELPRPFKTPLVPFVPIMGMTGFAADDGLSALADVAANDRLARHRDGDLLHLWPSPQQGAGRQRPHRRLSRLAPDEEPHCAARITKPAGEGGLCYETGK